MIDVSAKAKATQTVKTKTKPSSYDQCQLGATQNSCADSDSDLHSAAPPSWPIVPYKVSSHLFFL